MATPPIFPDEDEDGEADSTDRCPKTLAGQVDGYGCSRQQFCAATELRAHPEKTRRTKNTKGKKSMQAKRICEASDWKNDEPLGKKPRDCRFDKSTGQCTGR